MSFCTMYRLLVTAVAFLLVEVSRCQVSIDGCGETKACFQDPLDCDTSSPDCRFISWKKSALGDTYEFEISGGIGKGEEYIAMAFGLSGGMKDADLYYCDGTELQSGSIRREYDPPVIKNNQNDVVLKSAATANGVAQCVFVRPRSVRKRISGNQFHDFDLSKEKYWLLVAVGTMEGGELQYHKFRTLTSASHDFADSAPVIPIEFTTPGPEPRTTGAACQNKIHILYIGFGVLSFLISSY